MTGFIDELLAEVIGQQVALMSAVARLEARTDGEALHDLRIALRRLRSLLRPIRGVPGVEELEHAAAEVGRLSGPIRDLEVLLPALAAEGLRDALAVRRPVLESGYVAVLASQPLHRLQLCLDVWPALLRTAQRHAVLDGLHGRVRKRLRRQWKTLRAELADTTYEHWHPLRLRIKRVRYGLEAYPHDCSIPGSLLGRSRRPSRRWAIGTTSNSGCCDASASRTWRPCARSGRHASNWPGSVPDGPCRHCSRRLPGTEAAGIPIGFFPRIASPKMGPRIPSRGTHEFFRIDPGGPPRPFLGGSTGQLGPGPRHLRWPGGGVGLRGHACGGRGGASVALHRRQLRRTAGPRAAGELQRPVVARGQGGEPGTGRGPSGRAGGDAGPGQFRRRPRVGGGGGSVAGGRDEGPRREPGAALYP